MWTKYAQVITLKDGQDLAKYADLADTKVLGPPANHRRPISKTRSQRPLHLQLFMVYLYHHTGTAG